MPIELMPHQKKAVSRLRNGNILVGGTGSGKSATALAYYNDCEDAERLYIITTAMKRDSGDWQAEAREFGLYPDVDSWNNLEKYEDVEGAFFIFDEQRVVGSGIWVKAFLNVTKKNRWILLSATPGDTWIDYLPVFVANGFYRNRTEFIRNHVVWNPFMRFPKVDRYLETGILMKHLDSILVQMPYKRHTTRRVVPIYVDYDKEMMDVVWKRRWNFLEERPIRQVSELFALMRRVANSDISRLERLKDLQVVHPKLVVFYNFDYELDILRMLDVPMAEWNGHKHEPIPDTDEWIYLVQYMAGAEGWNCIETDAMVFYSMTYSYRQFMQAQGRIDRLNTPYDVLTYYVFKSASVIDSVIFRALEKKRSFNEKTALKEMAGS